jgi:hypothetical protein
MKKTIGASLIALLLLAACGSPDQTQPGSGGSAGGPNSGTCARGVECDDMHLGNPDDTVSSTPGPDDGNNADPEPRRVRPRPGMADLYRLGWDDAKVSKNGKKVTLVFYNGVEPCYVLDHIDVDYNEKNITITMFSGHDPEAGDDVACIEIAELLSTRVKLSEPVGDRTIVDGAD